MVLGPVPALGLVPVLDLVLDLVVVTPFLDRVWASKEDHPLEGRKISVVSADGLIQMKRATGRKQDEADAEHLEQGHDRP